jgi:hypothetical protein
LSDVVNSSERKQKVVVLRELRRAIIYTTEMSKQVKQSHVRDTVHILCVLRCRADTCEAITAEVDHMRHDLGNHFVVKLEMLVELGKPHWPADVAERPVAHTMERSRNEIHGGEMVVSVRAGVGHPGDPSVETLAADEVLAIGEADCCAAFAVVLGAKGVFAEAAFVMGGDVQERRVVVVWDWGKDESESVCHRGCASKRVWRRQQGFFRRLGGVEVRGDLPLR